MDTPEQPVPIELEIDLPSTVETGMFADFANVWHTPATFVLDFLSVKRPPVPVTDGETGVVHHATVAAVVGARVRIPPEQIFPLISALQKQGQQWLEETGRAEPPDTWLPR
ncbi:MAG: DUF3467 domain-containing protein [Microbacteriaceae bacterium]